MTYIVVNKFAKREYETIEEALSYAGYLEDASILYYTGKIWVEMEVTIRIVWHI